PRADREGRGHGWPREPGQSVGHRAVRRRARARRDARVFAADERMSQVVGRARIRSRSRAAGAAHVTLVDRDRAVVWHPYTQMKTAMPPLPIIRGQGVYLYTEDGRTLLDGISSWWVNIHGHSNPRLNHALSEQAKRLEHVIFAGATHEPAVELAERLVGILP